ncbi:hypothetical protein P0Y35_02755 [Kiritimatiellaeota bacterium B1221]|nr:hypothetical protein [Kiritimatiellaeota bacterium B1221]
MKSSKILLILLCAFCSRIIAQMPSEALLVINGHSLEAMQIAHEYARARNFPDERILVLTPPRSFFRKESGSPKWTVSLDEAETHLLKPVMAKIEALQDASPTALILSPEWPTRVQIPNSPEISITGYLGCRGKVPAPDLVKYGRAISPWFSPPPDTPQKRGRLLRYPVKGMKESPFYPAAMLGVYYLPMTTERIQEQLETAVTADYRQPVGSIVFETNADVRTRTRLAQYKMAESRLTDKGIPVSFISPQESPPKKVIGVMGGTAHMNISRYQGKLLPGVFADHLTSHAATFDVKIQTKLTEWLQAGAVASAGTVTEPYAIWMKFPEAAFFERYLRGTTLLEALMQSIASPFQVLIVGDPLCRPWAKELNEIQLATEWDSPYLKVEASGIPQSSMTQMHLFVDGHRVEGDGPIWNLPRNAENTGPELELILHARYLWAPPEVGTIKKIISTPFPETLELKGSAKSDHVALKLKSKQVLMMVDIFRGNQKIHSVKLADKKPDIELSLLESGTGPVTLRAKAVTQEGEIRWSNFLELNPKAPQ